MGRGVSGATVELLVKLRDEATRQLGGIEQSMARSARKMQGMGLVVAGVGAAGMTAMTLLGRQSMVAADDIADSAAAANLSAEEYQRLGYVIQQSGGDMNDIVKITSKLTKTAADAAKGNKLQKEALNDLNVEYRNSNGSLKTSMEMLLDMSDAFATGKLSTEKMAAALDVLGIRGGAKLFNTLKLGRQGILDMMASAKGVVSNDTIDKLDKLNAKWEGMTLDLRKLKMEAIAPLIPMFEKTMEFIGGITEKFSQLSPETKGFIAKAAVGASAALMLGGGLMFVGGAIKGFMVIKAAGDAVKIFGMSVNTGMAALLKFLLLVDVGSRIAGVLAATLGGIAKGIGHLINNDWLKEFGGNLVKEGGRYMKQGALALVTDVSKELVKGVDLMFGQVAEAAEKNKPKIDIDTDTSGIDEVEKKLNDTKNKAKETFGFALREILGAFEYVPEAMKVQSRTMGPELLPVSLSPAFAGAGGGPGVKQVNLQFNFANRKEIHDQIDRELDREGV